ncbi:aldehyde dehydrogenase [Laribacter hongkongensis]|uniref:aldehyde dehydrogenase n=1 Tax=Laribacter hongkongensis TaxID=168471 RepID=UPI001EFE2004|nr:aldehyde dehydrogenase [Laribacter hongkongensis]MCG9080523.1 aldehyde dehydrogenase [Laribacter hongkongensis]
MTTPTDWHARVARLQPETRAFVAGRYCHARDGRTFDCLSPVDGRLLGKVAWCCAADVDAAVQAARQAFERGDWAGLPPRERKARLLRLAGLIEQHAEELALLETLDMGKPVSDALAVDMAGSAYTFAWYAEAVDKWSGEVAPLDPSLLGLVTREPVGVVAAIVPWNFPLLMASWKIAPALAAGNSVILKPSEKSPLTAIRLAALAAEAGLPDGVLQVLPGAGDTGRLLAGHMDVDCVAFTGSTAVGRQIAGCAAASNLKRTWLELGGKSPQLILADCPDLEQAARAVAGGIFFNQGEMCSAGSRVLVHNSLKDALIDAVSTAAGRWLPGDPLNPATRMGAIVDEQQFRKVQDYLDSGRREASLLFGGDVASPVPGGWYVNPTAFLATPGCRIEREEIFGPVLTLIGFDDPDDAIRIANDSIYGLAAAVWTSSLSSAHRVSRALRAGTVWVNCYDEGGDMNLPFGGFRQSGNGRDKSLHALDKYTELKTTLIKP